MVCFKLVSKPGRKAWLTSLASPDTNPEFSKKPLKQASLTQFLVPLNVVTRQALEELVPAAKKHDVGIAVMKPLSAKTSNLITCLYQPSLSLLSDEPELKNLLGKDQEHDGSQRFEICLEPRHCSNDSGYEIN